MFRKIVTQVTTQWVNMDNVSIIRPYNGGSWNELILNNGDSMLTHQTIEELIGDEDHSCCSNAKPLRSA